MIFCTSCGARNDDGTRFCISCGHALQAQNNVAAPLPTAVPMPGVRSLADVADATDATDAAAPTVPQKMSRRTMIILCAIGALIIVLAAVFITLRSTVFSPQGPLNSYVSAIAEGDYEKASKLVDPGVENDARALMVNKAGENESRRIKNVEVSSINQNRVTGKWEATVSYSVDGVQKSSQITMESAGKKLLFFDSWKVASPMLTTLKIAVPKTMTNVSVNGVDIDLSKAATDKSDASEPDDPSSDVDYSEMVEYSVPAYPGVYNVGFADSQYVTGNEVKINDAAKAAYLVPEATDKLKSEILSQVQKRIDDCTASSALSKDGCSFSNGSFSSSSSMAYTNIKRTATNTPEIAELDLMSGSFTTTTIQTTITYQERYYSDQPWENDSESDSGTISGTISLSNEKLTVDIPNTDEDSDGGW
ncbi:zinc-ribbon domain-containing protein [Bifidobacterium sp. SMB2]|uniref:Zinc-ribbon domain-containing protein n=1 Tax=Bifidobacterium saimiriisciurei TaxID=2661627 RepID=A0ABX0CB51_9BIFI|nr:MULTISPECIES: zinc-ribbon domain-containing protein [Bifidobacterium]NEG96763.1 zinc-ribbon domain-containing protein [Bifidobacterium sp. SMB2]NEH12329.1 zinc-ribbon domain-containing protein [Bifidobacterium saimiriisciurei]